MDNIFKATALHILDSFIAIKKGRGPVSCGYDHIKGISKHYYELTREAQVLYFNSNYWAIRITFRGIPYTLF